MVEKEKKLDQESLLRKKKGLEELSSKWNIYINERSYELESKENTCIVRWRHSQRYVKWSRGAKKLEGKLSSWSEGVKPSRVKEDNKESRFPQRSLNKKFHLPWVLDDILCECLVWEAEYQCEIESKGNFLCWVFISCEDERKYCGN